MDQQQEDQDHYMGNGYALSGKIMLSAIIILFFVVVLMVGLHLYARWYLLRARRRQLRRARLRRTHLVFYVDPENPNSLNTVNPPRGLDSQVIKSLPVFIYSKQTNPEPVECSVCLSEFEENESGRVLPKCNHSFHVGCIDMWFHSHSTCPLCRSPVEPVNQDPNREIASDSNHELCGSCQMEETGGASTSDRRKPVEFVGVTIEVPRRNVNESLTESPSQGTRSPMSRMLSFTRILNWDRRGGNGLSSPGVSGSGTSTEVDIERGKDVARETQG